jgi:DNA-binding NtrC family response regulator
MKAFLSLCSILALVALLVSGCSKSGASVDTAGFEKSFASAESAVKASAAKVVDAIKKADYAGAVSELKNLASNVKVTNEQKNAVTELLVRVQQSLSELGSKAAGEAGKALGEAQKALGK